MNYQNPRLARNALDSSYALFLSPPEPTVNTTEAAIDAHEPTVLKNHKDLAWLGALILLCSAAITCGTVYFSVNDLFF